MRFILALSVFIAFVAGGFFDGHKARADTGDGTFVMRCDPVFNKQADPIVTPGPKGTLSAHLHTFSANRSTDSDSTYDSMVAQTTGSCRFKEDLAGYWFNCLINPANEGVCVNPRFTFFYYKNPPVSYRTTTPFPPDLRMVIHDGNANTGFWDCFDKNPPGSFTTSIPRCTTDDLQVRLKSPNCWDGKNLDTVTRDVSGMGVPSRNPFTGLAYPNDHISHVVKFVNNACPADHPVKLPMGNFFVRWAPPAGGPGWHLSDGTLQLHFDFWNTWHQSFLNQLVSKCLSPVGKNCGQVTDANFAGL